MGGSVQHRQGIGFANEFGVEIEIEVEAPLRLGSINTLGHEQVGSIVIAFRFDEAAVESGKLGIGDSQLAGQDLKFFAASAFDQTATNQMVNDLVTLAVADGVHQTGDPGAGVGLAEGDGALLEEVQHEVEVLKLFDGDGVEFLDAREQVAVFLEVQGAGGGLAFEMRVVHQNCWEVGEDFRQPIGRHFFAEQKHERLLTRGGSGAREKSGSAIGDGGQKRQGTAAVQDASRNSMAQRVAPAFGLRQSPGALPSAGDKG